jgi:integrase/recombinase XerD
VAGGERRRSFQALCGATHLADKLTEAQMKIYFGWSEGSDVPSVYVHLNGRDVEEALLRIYSIRESG